MPDEDMIENVKKDTREDTEPDKTEKEKHEDVIK